MAVSLVQGTYLTSSGATEERPYAHEVKLSERNPDQAPFVALLDRMATRGGLSDPRFYTYVNQYAQARTTVQTNYNSGAVSIVVASGQGKLFRVGNFFVNLRTQEQFCVSAISTDTLTVVGGTTDGEGSNAAGLAGDQLVIVGGRQEAGSTPTALQTKNENDYNVTAIINECVKTSGTEMKTATRPGEKIGQIRKQNLKNGYTRTQHMLSNLLFYAQRCETTAADGSPLRMARGIRRWITSGTAGNERSTASNVKNVGGAIVDPFMLNDAVASVCGVGSSKVTKKLVIMGTAARNRLWGPLTASGQWSVDQKASDKLGFQLEQLETSSGVVKILTDQTLSGTGGQNTISGASAIDGAGGDIFIIDMDHVFMHWQRPLVLYRGDESQMIPASGSRFDGVVDEYLGEGTVGLRFPEAHYLLTGFSV